LWPAAPSMAIFVSWFDFDTAESAIAEHFQMIGSVSSVELVGRGAAVLRFEDKASANQAVDEMNETTIPGNRRYIFVKLDGEKGSKGGKKGKKGWQEGKEGGKKGKGYGYGNSGKGGREYEDDATCEENGKKGKGYGYGSSGKGGRSYEDHTTFDGEFQTGRVAKFLTDRGFGYITPDDEGECDIFVHFSSICASGFRALEEGQRVSFGIEPDPKGKGKGSLRAVAVSVI